MAKVYAVKGKGIFKTWAECEKEVKGVKGVQYKSFMSEDDANAWLNEDVPKVSVCTDDSVDFAEMFLKAQSYLDYLHDNELILDDLYDKAVRQVKMSIDTKSHWRELMKSREGKPLPDHVNVYVDGSYNPTTNEFGYGVYMDDGEMKHMLYGRGQCVGGGRNVEGEVAASKQAFMYIETHPQYKSVTVYHDYEGVGKWADHLWKVNHAYDEFNNDTSLYRFDYVRYVDSLRDKGRLSIDFQHVKGHEGNEGNEIVDKLAKIGCGIPLTSSEEKFIGKYSYVPGYPVSFDASPLDSSTEYDIMGNEMQLM